MPETQNDSTPQDFQGVSGDVLLQNLERIERLEEEKASISDDIKEIFQESKSQGFDVKVMRELLKLRKMEKNELDEKETMLLVYRKAIGMLH